MKKALIVSFKIIFWVVFFYHLGIFKFIASSKPDPNNPYNENIVEKSGSREEQAVLDAQMFGLYNKKVELAKEKVSKGGIYTPTDYFTDMRDINLFRREKGVLQRPFYAELQDLMQKGFNQNESLIKTMDAAREIAVPGSVYYDNRKAAFKTNWAPIRNWWLNLYLTILPWAFILFLIWGYEGSDLKKIRVKNPLNFLLSLALYPLVIFIAVRAWWINIGRHVAASVEVRRTKEKMFSLFSQDEIALVKQFAKSRISLKEFRVLHGKSLQHGFTIALVFTIFLYCVPRVSYSQEILVIQVNTFSLSSVSMQVSIRGSTYYLEKEKVMGIRTTSEVDLMSSIVTEDRSKVLYYLCIFLYILSKGYRRALDHIPLLVTALKKIVINKKSKYEKNTFNAFVFI